MSIGGVFSQSYTDPIRPQQNLDIRNNPEQYQQPQQNYNYQLQEEARHFRNKGITNLVCGGIWAGCGAVFIAMQPNPYYYYETPTYFWCGVTLCTIGGIEMIFGIAQVSHSAVLLSRSKQITLTPSKRDIGFAINF